MTNLSVTQLAQLAVQWTARNHRNLTDKEQNSPALSSPKHNQLATAWYADGSPHAWTIVTRSGSYSVALDKAYGYLALFYNDDLLATTSGATIVINQGQHQVAAVNTKLWNTPYYLWFPAATIQKGDSQ